jgi:hypothetical protein
MGGILPLSGLITVVGQGLVGALTGAVAALLTLFFLKNQEFADILSAIRRLVSPGVVLPPVADEPIQP